MSSKSNGGMPRRKFITLGLSTVGGLVIGSSICGQPSLAAKTKIVRTKLDPEELKGKYGFKGMVTLPPGTDFSKAAVDRIWNQRIPDRRPDLIVRPTDDDDVIAVVKFARDKSTKIAVKGGGHNWCHTALRDRGIMVDLAEMKGVVSLDVENRKAIVRPILSNREAQAALNPKGLAFPSGHCPQVKMSGYLLSGGMAWNHGEWGPGVGSVDAIELVTPEGKLITASAKENSDYFWAARGGGSSFFGIALRYHLRLYPLPKAITSSVYYYPYENAVEVAEWLGPLARKLPSSIELSLFLVAAPPDLASKSGSTGWVCLVTATNFADTKDEAERGLALLDSCPLVDKCLKKSIATPTTFDELFDASGALWPEGLRCRVDAVFSDAPLPRLIETVHGHMTKSPSKKTVFLFTVFTGKNVPPPTPDDAAFSMTANLYGGPWTMWDKEVDDSANLEWHEKLMKLLNPHLKGHYVSETDTIGHPDYAKQSFSSANWKRLASLRKKYDPTGIFFALSGDKS